MTTRVTEAHRRPPAWTTWVLGLFAVLATISIAQGFVDVVIPVYRGEAPFGFLFAQTERFGPAFFGLYIFVHNVGLACLVPGYGFIAAYFERRTRNRGLIGIILAGAVLVSLLIALQYLVQTPQRFDLALAIPLLVGEALGVGVMAIAAARELWGFVPTRVYEWSLATPLRRLGRPFAASVLLLALLAAWETQALLGA